MITHSARFRTRIVTGVVLLVGAMVVGFAGGIPSDASAQVVSLRSVHAPPASRLSAGDNHTCYVSSGGKVSCWGNNADGELGDGTRISRALPVTVTGIGHATAVSAGSRHTCALLSNKTVFCWGWNGLGQLGTGTQTSSSTPIRVKGISTAMAVSAGGAGFTAYSCALLKNRTVSCWGGNYDGELGNGLKLRSATPVRVKGISNAVQISGGLSHVCARLATGAIKCWGYNSSGQLGNGATRNGRVPVLVKGISTAVQVSAGGTHTCALLSSGKVRCWGDNDNGQLGIGKLKPFHSDVPLAVKLPAVAVFIAAGGSNTCALLRTGVGYCWGSNDSGELGVGKTFWSLTQSYRPLLVKRLTKASALSLGDEDACAVLRSGAVKCWGAGDSGQLGNGMTGLSATPVVAKGVKNAVAVDAEGAFTCAVLNDGTVSCWGRNLGGQLGISPKVEVRLTPAPVPGVTDAIAVTGGVDHACALISDGTISCWGANKSGELGNGTKVSSIKPVKVSGISNAVQIGAGGDFSCALLASHVVKCWGTNYASQLGTGNTTGHTRPVLVSGINDAVALDVGDNTSCAVLSDGTVECWGGYDPTDPNSITGTPRPTSVGVTNAVEASVASECALISGGTVTCWGEDPLNPDAGDHSIHQITGLANGLHLSASCTLVSGGGVDCWGSSYEGQLGNGNVSFAGSLDTAVAVSGITNATAIGSSGGNACAVLSDGTVNCWGSNYWGQLGNGQQGFSSVPVSVVGLP
ncbi:MAG: RCC1 repeat-containing protein [Gaiellaceae bacterium]|jgi:alpha-tubulin suppressor-like RCC1 family protein